MLKERLILQIAVLLLGCSSTIAGDYELYYQGLPTEVARVVPVDIPANTVSITDFGGVGDGIALNTAAFSKAISTLAKKGGGRLTVPAGIWLTGPIALKDNIDFHLEKNAVVYFSPNKLLYVAEREGKGRVLPCIRASKCTNIAITDKGIGIAGLNCVHDIGVTDCSIVYRQNATLIDEETAALKLQQVKLKKDHRESIQ